MDTLHFTRWGHVGHPRILLVHGWMGSGILFRDFAPKLAAEGFDVVAADLRERAQRG